MRTHCARILLAVSASVLAGTLTATIALAATTWTVKPGGAVSAKLSVVVVKDATTGYQIRCPSTIKATLKGGTGLPGTGIGTVSSFTFGTCAGPLGFTYTLTLRHLPYTLNATSYDSSSGTTTAKIIGIHGTLEGPACSAVIDGTGAGADNGTLAINYANSTQKLKFLTTGGNLRFYQVVGCAGLIRSQDHLTLSGTGPVAPAQKITSP